MEWLGSAEIDAIDSCSPEGGFMGQLWSGHRTTIDLLVSVETIFARDHGQRLQAGLPRGPGSHTAAVP